MVGGPRVEPGTRGGSAIDHHGAAATVVEGGAAGIGEVEVTARDRGKAGVDIASGECGATRADLGEGTTTGECTRVGGAGVVRTEGEGIRPHRVVPAALYAAEVVGSGSGEAEGERAGVGDIEIKRGAGESARIGEDKRSCRDPGGAVVGVGT